jgi:hypothetical protein
MRLEIHTMMKQLAVGSLALVVGGFSSVATGALVLSLSSNAELTSAGVGEALTIDVVLSGLEPGQELDALAATVAFDGMVLGVPDISAATIVPDPLDHPLDFVLAETAGLADAAFLTFGIDAADHIAANGVFYSFTVTPLAPGAGALAFDFVGATQFNAAASNNPIVLPISAAAPLPFTVVPEPNSLSGMLAAVVTLTCRRRRDRHAA